jgi:uncharacterized protein (TIRG00374 family)
MKARFGPALFSLIVLSLAYVGLLAYLDLKSRVFENIGQVALATAFVAMLSLLAFMLRYGRWAWLLQRRGFATPRVAGCLSYLAGFALTALPGKLGELVRIRYFAKLGVPPAEVIACFFFERVIDLVAVLLLASLIAGASPGLHVAAVFVALVLGAVLVLCSLSRAWRKLAVPLRRAGWRRTARTVRIVGSGLVAATAHVRPKQVAVSLAIGLIAFGVQSLGFVHLISTLGIAIRLDTAVAVFPLATLVGAASMIPGGIGTTEAATVFILRQLGAPFEAAVLAAVGMRLGTLWFAIALGLVAATALELRARRPLAANRRDLAAG